MSEYHKIETLYERDEQTHRLKEPLVLKNRIYGALKTWVFTEKVDGTNIRCIWRDGNVTFGGKTDNAQIHADLVRWLYEHVAANQFAAVFPDSTHVVLYGEGFGAGIQKGGGDYTPTKQIILFDVAVFDAEGRCWWLSDDNVRDVAMKFSLSVVPLLGEMTLEQATELVREGVPSQCACVRSKQAEGVVGRPVETLYDKKGHRLILKLKTKDFAPKQRREEAAAVAVVGQRSDGPI